MLETKREPFIIRHAAPEDALALTDTIARIDEETEFLGVPGEFRQRWADGFAERLKTMGENGTGAYVLAAHDGEIIGFLGAFAGMIDRARGVIYIAHVGIRRAWRGRGVGAALFAAIEAWARGQGAWRLELRVDEENARGLALYRKRGFAVEGRIVDAASMDGAWRNHLWMAKELRRFAQPPWAPLELPANGQSPRERAPLVRRVRLEDAALVRRFEQELLGETPFLLKQPHEVRDDEAARKEFAEQVDQPTCLLLAAVIAGAQGERIVGYANAAREVPTRMHHNAFALVNVLRAHWGLGLGQDLAARIEGWAREQNVRRLTTVLSAHNTRALRFATARGFRQEVFSPRYAVIDGRAVDRVRMGKILAP